MQGIVLELDLKTDTGLIKAEDNNRYEFKTDSCREEIPLVGSTVDFELKDNTAHAIYTIKKPLKAKLDWLFWFLFCSRGRISRKQFVSFLSISVIAVPVFSKLVSLASFPIAFSCLFWLINAHVVISVMTKRFHDSNASSALLMTTLGLGFILLLLVSKVLTIAFLGTLGIYVLMLFFTLCVFFCLYLCLSRGSLGKNRYGEETKGCQTLKLK